MFNANGSIINPNAPRPAQPGVAPFGGANIPIVRFDSLRPRNQRNFNINALHGGTPGGRLDLACHHVVGWDIIWGFWNKLISTQQFELARKYLALFGAPASDTKDMAKWVTKGGFADKWNCEQMMCWKPNNLVRGPNDRSDDPNINAELEDKIDFKMIGRNLYGGRLPLLCETGRAMVAFIQAADVRKAETAISYFTQVRAATIMEWDETLWVVDEAFPRYSNTPSPNGGFDVVKPKWRIHSGKT